MPLNINKLSKTGEPQILRQPTCCNKKSTSKSLVKGLNIEEYNNLEIVMFNLCKGFHLLKRKIQRDSSNVTEAATGGFLKKKGVLKISQNSQENTFDKPATKAA